MPKAELIAKWRSFSPEARARADPGGVVSKIAEAAGVQSTATAKTRLNDVKSG